MLPGAGGRATCSSRSRTWAPPGCPRAPARWPSKGERRPRPRRLAGAAARGRHGAVRDHDLRVAGADAVRGRAAAGGRGARRLRAGGRCTPRRSARSPTRTGCACSTASELVGDMPVTALVDECPLYDLEPAEPADRLAVVRSAARRSSAASDPADDASARCSRSPNVASRRWAFEQYDFLVGSRTVRRPEQADAAVLQPAARGTRHRPRDRRLDRRQRPPGGLRPVHRRGRGGLRVRREPRLRRRRAARASRTASTSATPRSRTSPGS